MNKIPSAGTPTHLDEVLFAMVGSCFCEKDFASALQHWLPAKHCMFTNSGTTAFYLILKVLKARSEKRTILMPSYTAPSLTLPIKKAGLRLRLVEMSLETFNIDHVKLLEAIDKYEDDLLAVMPVHMYGLPYDHEKLMEVANQKGFTLIEDAASAMGTKKNNGNYAGAMSHIGFISFNRGKNLSTTCGGVVITNDDALAEKIVEEQKNLPELDIKGKLRLMAMSFALSLAVRPWFYTWFISLVSKYKYSSLHEDFVSFAYTKMQKNLGYTLLNRSGEIFRKREANGRYLHAQLRGIEGVTLPDLPEGWHIVFNQFPLLLPNTKLRDKAFGAIVDAGVEATVLYDKPVHRIYPKMTGFNPDEQNDPFPNATSISKRLLLIPPHAIMKEENLATAVDALRSSVQADLPPSTPVA